MSTATDTSSVRIDVSEKRAFNALRFSANEVADMNLFFYKSIETNPCVRLWTGFRDNNKREWTKHSFLAMRSDYELFHKKFKSWTASSEEEEITENTLSVALLGSHEYADAHVIVNKCIAYCKVRQLSFVLTRQHFDAWQYPNVVEPDSVKAKVSTFFGGKTDFKYTEYALTVDMGLTSSDKFDRPQVFRPPPLIRHITPTMLSPPKVSSTRPPLVKTTTSTSLERIVPKYTSIESKGSDSESIVPPVSRMGLGLQSRHTRSLSSSKSESNPSTRERSDTWSYARGGPEKSSKRHSVLLSSSKSSHKKKKDPKKKKKQKKQLDASSGSSGSDVVLSVSGSDGRV
jgi:hypothetical protein